ncbi:DNA polymerase III subunit delta' [Pseudohaliea rubra]|uniref:DNA-directed DNA polymerase n=1 Tax=Pseudohaliea rubra DSM 19751 TaxID=1265313 RepID=A0A095VRA1_9GAMM|nr:DNA polymerase III subunit delta' [Pseudohaliea rubra]KGE03578.1 DNA polymerase III delta prime subunit [Pseudohaliea rubra DSM 19751]
MSDELETLSPVTPPLPWQHAAWERLLTSHRDGSLPHALLLAGLPGLGCERFAQALARYLLCEAPVEGMNCGHCKACRLSASGAHGDFLVLEPTGKGLVISVGQVREAIAFGTQTASLGRCKVLLIAPAERMNAAAANALLKTLEEPPAETYLLLVTGAESRLPATVRSRCQVLRFPVPVEAECLPWLAEGGDPETARQALALAARRPLRAAALLREGELAAASRQRAALEALLAGRTTAPAVEVALAELSLEGFLELLARGLQDAVRALEGPALRGPRGHGLLASLDEVLGAARAVAAGANPQPELVRTTLLGAVETRLGERGGNAKLRSVFSPVTRP